MSTTRDLSEDTCLTAILSIEKHMQIACLAFILNQSTSNQFDRKSVKDQDYFAKNKQILPSCEKNLLSNEDMILALAGHFKQQSHEPENFR